MHCFVISSWGIKFDTTAKMLNFCKSMDELKLTCQICDLRFALGGTGKELEWKNIDSYRDGKKG